MAEILMAMLGAILLARSLIDQAQLDAALAAQRISGSRLGEILIGNGALSYLGLYQALADHHRLPFADLLNAPPDNRLLMNGVPPEIMLERRAVPWRRQQDGGITVAVADYNDETVRWCKTQFGTGVSFAITSPLDIRRTVESTFGVAFEKASRLSLWQKAPMMSARLTMPPLQKRIGYMLLFIAIVCLTFAPAQSAVAFLIACNLAFLATMIFKTAIFTAGISAPRDERWSERLSLLDERNLPVYTILIPMHREAATLPRMLESMASLDYPPSKLDIKLVLESDDHETLDAAHTLKPSYQFDIIRVPPSEPRTKPKACNYALRFARGEMITVFDADDRPEPLQLKKAVLAFRDAPQDVACLQARLNYYNTGENVLTRFFSLEYTILFQFMLHGLQRLGIPIPLGGTSNHMPAEKLRELGEWDPYNVTEDADLGTRLSARGARTLMLDSFTMEEAPVRTVPWIRQRSRWIKGYMQTWLVHMRDPVALYRSLGPGGFIGFQFFIGLSCVTFLVAPVVLVMSALWLGMLAGWSDLHMPTWMQWLTGINLALNLLVHGYMGLVSAAHYRKHRLSMAILSLLYPLYLFLHSIASYKALYQLIVKPHFWEKTTHGIAHKQDMVEAEQLLMPARLAG